MKFFLHSIFPVKTRECNTPRFSGHEVVRTVFKKNPVLSPARRIGNYGPDLQLQPDDFLLLYGSDENIRKFLPWFQEIRPILKRVT